MTTPAHATIPAAELTPGQFFRVDDRWYRAVDTPVRDEGEASEIKVILPATGETAWICLYDEVTVSDENTIPATFQVNTLLRRARTAREKSEQQLHIADTLERLALDIRTTA